MPGRTAKPVLETERDAIRVLDLLDRWSDRVAGHHAQRREYPRRTIRMPVTVYFEEDRGDSGNRETMDGISVQVWMRNVSRRGLGFISRHRIASATVILCLPTSKSAPVWIKARVVRSRAVHDGFYEYGVAFVGRVPM